MSISSFILVVSTIQVKRTYWYQDLRLKKPSLSLVQSPIGANILSGIVSLRWVVFCYQDKNNGINCLFTKHLNNVILLYFPLALGPNLFCTWGRIVSPPNATSSQPHFKWRRQVWLPARLHQLHQRSRVARCSYAWHPWPFIIDWWWFGTPWNTHSRQCSVLE